MLPQLLGQVRVVEAHVDGRHQPHDRVPHRRGQPPGRGTVAVAVHERAGAPGLEPALQPPDLPHSDPEGGGHLGIRQPPATQRLQQPRPMQFLPAQREGLH